MPKKSLLNESQVRQFMKLASLQPLASGFVEGLTKGDPDEEMDESHGRGRREGAAGYNKPDNNTRPKGLTEEEDLEAELGATEDELGAEDQFADEEADELDDLEGPEAPAPDEGADKMISVADLLAALESAIEEVTGEEVETEMDPDLEADEEEADLDVDVADDMEADTDMEMDDEMLAEEQGADDREDEHLGAKDGKESGKKQSMKDRRKEMRGARRADDESGDPVPTQEGVFGGREKKWDRIAKGLDPSSDPAPHGEDEEEAAAQFKAQRGTETADQQAAVRAKRRPRRDHTAGMGGGMRIGGITAEGQDEIVEAITKRVAARILKSALKKK